jgi:hypothetical protein
MFFRLFFALYITLFSFQAFANGPLGGRANVMECSHEEVVAYMELPDSERAALKDYEKWEQAYQSTEIEKAKDDPTVCLSVLYGDMTAMGDQVKAAAAQLMSMEIPSMSTIFQKITDEITKSICSRAQAAVDSATDRISSEVKTTRNMARREVMRRYGQAAMERYITDAVIPPNFQAAGLEYRNGGLDKEAFRRGVKRRWKRELNELQESAID